MVQVSLFSTVSNGSGLAYLTVAAQPGAVADAASGERDRGDFESWIWLNRLPDLSVRRG